MRPIPHNRPAEGETTDERERPTIRGERAETVDDEVWLEAQEF